MRCISPEMALGGHAIARLTSAFRVLSCLAARKIGEQSAATAGSGRQSSDWIGRPSRDSRLAEDIDAPPLVSVKHLDFTHAGACAPGGTT
jgi:hypothetical protein